MAGEQRISYAYSYTVRHPVCPAGLRHNRCRRGAWDKNTDDADRYNLGNVLGRQGKQVEARHAYRQALALRPAYASAANNLANSFFAERRLHEAVTWCGFPRPRQPLTGQACLGAAGVASESRIEQCHVIDVLELVLLLKSTVPQRRSFI